MPRILVTPSQFHEQPGAYRDVLEGAGFEVVYPPDGDPVRDPARLLELLEGIDAVVASVEPYTPRVLAERRVSAIARTGVGFDSIDVAAATAAGVAVTITPGVLEQSVAEHTLALILAVYRGLGPRSREIHEGRWSRSTLPRLAGQTAGIVGLGRIGKRVAELLLALDVHVIAHDPFFDEAFAAAHGIRRCTLDELLERADIVSLHSPCTPETTDLINRQTLARMKRGSVLINMARGGLVDEQAVVEALESGHLLGAGLDVFKTEPLPVDSPLMDHDGAILTTHTAGVDHQSLSDMGRLAAQCLVDLHAGRWPEACVVNPDVRPRWKWSRWTK